MTEVPAVDGVNRWSVDTGPVAGPAGPAAEGAAPGTGRHATGGPGRTVGAAGSGPTPSDPVSPDPAAVDPVSLDLWRAGQGDQAAFARVVDALGPIVFGVARRTLRAEALAEEVTQDVLVQAWRLAPRFDPARGSARAWLATMAHRRAVDRVRSEEARRGREERDARYAIRPHDEVSEAVADRLDRGRVRAAFLALDEARRAAVGLAYYEGRTYREVAVELGIAEGTAKTRIRDGLRQLRAAMGAPA